MSSFSAMMFGVIIPIIAGIIIFFSICFMIFFICDANSREDRVRIAITTILADIVLIVCTIVLMYVFSIIAIIIFILAAIWLIGQY